MPRLREQAPHAQAPSQPADELGSYESGKAERWMRDGRVAAVNCDVEAKADLNFDIATLRAKDA